MSTYKQNILAQLDSLPTSEALDLVHAWLTGHRLVEQSAAYKLGYSHGALDADPAEDSPEAIMAELRGMRYEG